MLSELESLKPVVQRQITEHNRARGGAIESNSINGTIAVNNITKQHMTNPYTYQVYIYKPVMVILSHYGQLLSACSGLLSCSAICRKQQWII